MIVTSVSRNELLKRPTNVHVDHCAVEGPLNRIHLGNSISETIHKVKKLVGFLELNNNSIYVDDDKMECFSDKVT